MKDDIGIIRLSSLKPSDLINKTIFIRCDFNVPLIKTPKGHYHVGDDTRIRRFIDLTLKKIHDLTEGDCRIIIGSHLGRPHKKKDHVGWDGIFNIQFISSHFDTLIRMRYGNTYTIFPPEIIDSHMKHSLEIVLNNRLPIGGIKFLPNLRYLLDPANTEPYREEFIRQLADISDIYINCAFGCSHRVTKSIKMLPQLMRQQGKLVVAGDLLYEEVTKLTKFAHKILVNPQKSVVVAGGAKITDKISILKEFVVNKVRGIFIGGKMVNCFLLAIQHKEQVSPFGLKDIPQMLLKKNEEENQNLIREVQLAEEIIELAEKNNVQLILPDDYKIVDDYSALNYEVKTIPDFNKELQLDLGPKTIENFSKSILFQGEIENVFWNGPLGAYDHPANNAFIEGSLELAKVLFREALIRDNFSVVIGGGDSAAILNKVSINELKKMIKRQIEKTLLKTVNRDLLTIGFAADDSYILWNYFASNFFVSTGGGAALEFMEEYLKDKGQKTAACYLAGTTALMESVSS